MAVLVSLAQQPRAMADEPAPSATAPTAEDRAAAQVLFDEGRALSDADNWFDACPKFAESMRLAPALGTQLNLARCYEKTDRLASAWINWVEAKQRATQAGSEKRAKIAGDRALALESRISFLTVRVAEPVDGLVVTRDGTAIGRAQWETRLPIDGGMHNIVVTAPDHRSWEKKVKIKNEGSHVVVRIPALKPLPRRVPSPGTPAPLPDPDVPRRPPDDGVNGQLVAGVVLTVLGAGGLGVGIGFGVAAMGKNDDSLTYCPDVPSRCTRDGIALRQDAFTFAHVSTGGFIAGGASLLTGVILMATAFAGPNSTGAAIRVVPVPNGLGVGGRF